MDSEQSKASKRIVRVPIKYRENALPTGESSGTRGEGSVVSRRGQMVNRVSSKADRVQSTSRRLESLDLNNAMDPELVMDAAPVNRAQHGPNEEGPANVIGMEAHNASEYCGGIGDLGQNLEYNVRVIRQLECRNLITSEFREKLLTWYCVKANEQGRRVLNAFIKTLKNDLGSLAGQLEHTFGGTNDLSIASSLTNL